MTSGGGASGNGGNGKRAPWPGGAGAAASVSGGVGREIGGFGPGVAAALLAPERLPGELPVPRRGRRQPGLCGAAMSASGKPGLGHVACVEKAAACSSSGLV